MSEKNRNFMLAPTSPTCSFEDKTVGRMKKELWDASDAEIDAVLAEYGMPSPCEWGKPGSYIQTTVRQQLDENRSKNDVVLIPLGCTELHGPHRQRLGHPLCQPDCGGRAPLHGQTGSARNLAIPPLMYGSHPYHHIGMPGTVTIREKIAGELLVDVMLGLWNDGWRKQIILNNHGQLWVLE